MPSRLAIVGLVVLALFAGCDGGCRKKKPAPVDANKDDAPVGIEILNLGSEPREKLEVGRWVGLHYDLEMQTDGSFGIRGLPPVKAPTSIIGFRVEVLRGTADPVLRDRDNQKLRLVEERAT